MGTRTNLPVTVEQWREYLRDYSAEVLASDELRLAVEEERASWLTEGQRKAGWLGFDAAAEAEVVAAEQRLGVTLPPAYRNFLLASNGWNWIGGLVDYPVDLLPADEIGWFAELEAELLDAWTDPDAPIFDEEELERLNRCLLISADDGGSGHYWLLHVDAAAEDGEPTVYEWVPGSGGDLEPWDDFAALATRTR
jgi:hypothetical protein